MDNYKSKGARRDMIDSMFTYVNKDLLICKLFYFFFFAAFGSLYPLLAIYFKQLGMNATQSGILMGFRPFIEFCSAPFWGGIADKLRKWRQLQLFSLFCWIVFTLAMAFVKPPAVQCIGDGNMTETDIINLDLDLIKPAYSTVYYKRDAVKDAFFTLLLIVVIGEFFSAPAITLADTVTLSYLGADTDNYGRQRMFGSLGWGLSMFFVGMALDHSTTFPEHPCEFQHHKEKNYIICFAVFSVLMSCAFITATQFKFPGQEDGEDQTLQNVVMAVKDKVTETITGKKKIDREQLVEEDDEFKFGQPKNTLTGAETGENTQQQTQPKLSENGKPLHISLESKTDMVTDVINSPGAQTMQPPDPDEPFLGRWVTVVKLLAHLRFVSVLFVVWFMGFGIGLIFTFLFWHLQDLGGSPTLFGVASVINHISELLAYFLCSRFIAAFGHIQVLYAGIVGNIVRFMYISWLKNPWWVLPFECVQGLTHAAVWATTCSYVMQAIPIDLRSSAQGILQGIHHGLGRGCGAVFGGILVYSFGSEVTFRAYGVTCIFVLIAFFGTNYFLKRQGILVDSRIPHETLDEDPQMTFDPHGVPSALARDLSSSKLNKQEEPIASYGSTLGTDARSNLEKAFTAPPQTAGQKTNQFDTDDFNPRATAYGSRDTAFSAQDEAFSNHGRDDSAWPRNDYSGQQAAPQSRDTPREARDPRDRYGTESRDRPSTEREDSYENSSRSQPSRDGYDQRDRSDHSGKYDDRKRERTDRSAKHDDTRRDRSGGYGRNEEPQDDRGDSKRSRGNDDAQRRHSMEQSEARTGKKERRRRQSGDVEGLREREDRERESRRHGDRDENRQRDDARGQRRHSKKRRSLEGSPFHDADPNPREQVVFEKLPDLSARAQQHQQPSRDERHQRDDDPYSGHY